MVWRGIMLDWMIVILGFGENEKPKEKETKQAMYV